MSTNLLRGHSILLGVAFLTAGVTAVAEPAIVNLDDDSAPIIWPRECTTEKPTLIGTKRIDDHAYLEREHVGCRSSLSTCPPAENGQEIPECGAGGDGERVSLVVDNTVVASETGAQVDVMTVRKDSPTARFPDGTAVIAASVQENGGLGGVQNITGQNRILAKLISGKWTPSSEVIAIADARRFKGTLSWDLPPSQSRLFLACFQKTWAQLRAEATDEWTNTKCGSYPISYKRFLDKNRWSLTVVQHFPLGGAVPAAVMKPAVESLAPNLGPPERSVGTCVLDATTEKAVSLLGSDARRELETNIRAQGGVRMALFKADGIQVVVEAIQPHPDMPGMASVIWTEGRALPNSPAIPWQAVQICTAANDSSELSTGSETEIRKQVSRYVLGRNWICDGRIDSANRYFTIRLRVDGRQARTYDDAFIANQGATLVNITMRYEDWRVLPGLANRFLLTLNTAGLMKPLDERAWIQAEYASKIDRAKMGWIATFGVPWGEQIRGSDVGCRHLGFASWAGSTGRVSPPALWVEGPMNLA